MPLKHKLSKGTGKAVIPDKSNQDVGNTSFQMTSEQERQFEVELCWCIQQLQTALRSGKLNKKQVQDHTKSLNKLMSNSVPIVQKRQIMRLSFGDYREKMAADEQKRSKSATSIKVMPAKPSNKSAFFKKSSFVTSSGGSFKFDFPHPQSEDLEENLADVQIASCPKNMSTGISDSGYNRTFCFSNNNFRFNFDLGEPESDSKSQ